MSEEKRKLNWKSVKIIATSVLTVLILLSFINGIYFRFDDSTVVSRWNILKLRFEVEKTSITEPQKTQEPSNQTVESSPTITFQPPQRENITIEIDGTISGYTYSLLKNRLEDVRNASVLLVFDSQGGYLSSIQQCIDLLEHLKTKNNLTYTSYIYTALSGAYLISLVSDEIYASPVALVGGLGSVFYLYKLEWIETVTLAKYKNLTAGELTEEQKQMLMEILSEIDDYYSKWIAERRGLNETFVENTLMTGYIFTSSKALEIGLIDGIKSINEIRESA